MNHTYGCSHSGLLCGPGYATPTAKDIAVALGRVCRWSGTGERFYPVLLHSMAVSELMPKKYAVYGLLHDATEAVMGDVPRPFKTEEYKKMERILAKQIQDSFGLPDMPPGVSSRLSYIDDAMLSAEVWAGVGPRGLLAHFPERDRAAEEGVRYHMHWSPEDCIRPDGRAVMAYLSRLAAAVEDSRVG